MKRCRLDKIASVTKRLALGRHVLLGDEIPARSGTVVACRVLNAKASYNTLEDANGRMVLVRPGDVVAGALGHRDALHGFSGVVPETVAVGDTLNLLNLGGVVGRASGGAPQVGEPFRLEVLGAVLGFPRPGDRRGRAANIADAALEAPAVPPDFWSTLPPTIAVVGTSMNSGKTTVACALIDALRRAGTSVAAGKLTGVSLRRDVYEMADSGADPCALFTDFGVVTTDAQSAVPAARSLVAHLVEAGPTRPETIVLELGDGLLGSYGVGALLDDPDLRPALERVVVCAADPVGAWGAVKLLRERHGLEAHLVGGPITNSPAGLAFCRDALALPTWNALHEEPRFLEGWLAGSALEVAV